MNPNLDTIVRLARANVPNNEIADQLGMSVDALKKVIFRARQRGVQIPTRRPGPPMNWTEKQHKAEGWKDRAAKDARLKTIPPDTRDLTALICGDPLPGRSALDMGGS
jgi:transposase